MITLYRLTITIKTSVENLENERWLMNLCRELAHLTHLKILKEGFARFEKQGATAFLVLAQSHLAIHTWPEFKTASIDILSTKEINEKDIETIKEYLTEKQIEMATIYVETIQNE